MHNVRMHNGMIEAVSKGFDILALQVAYSRLDLGKGQLVGRSQRAAGSLAVGILHVHAGVERIAADGVQRQRGLVGQQLGGLLVHVVQQVEVDFVGQLDVAAVGLDHRRKGGFGQGLASGGYALGQGLGDRRKGGEATELHGLAVVLRQRALLRVAVVHHFGLHVFQQRPLIVFNYRRRYAGGISFIQVIKNSHLNDPHFLMS